MEKWSYSSKLVPIWYLKGNMIFSVRVSSVNLCNGFWLLVDEQAYAMISSNEIDPKEIKLQVASCKYYIVDECTLWRCLAKKYRRNQKVLVLGKSANISQNRRYCSNINDFEKISSDLNFFLIFGKNCFSGYNSFKSDFRYETFYIFDE